MKNEMYMLDTNHCSLLMEGNATAQEKIRQNAGVSVATCIFVAAELLYMAYNSQKQETNLMRVQSFLSAIQIYNVDQRTAEIYAQLKAGLIAHFGPKEKVKRRRFTPAQLGLGENDLWIAAIVLQHDLTLVLADSDFLRLQAVRPLRLENWLG